MRYNVAMRYEVPQFIEIEQKIIGPFTWKQFVYLAGGAGALLITFLKLPFWLFVLIGLPIAALSAMLAFQKVNSRPFEVLLEAAFNFMTRNKFYLWNIDPRKKYIVTEEKSEDVSMNKEAQPQQQIPSGSMESLRNQLSIDDTPEQ